MKILMYQLCNSVAFVHDPKVLHRELKLHILLKDHKTMVLKIADFSLSHAIRPEMVVGWYHSHPGFGCWLSGVDINTQQSFEALNPRVVAVVIDPIQKRTIDFRFCRRAVKPLRPRHFRFRLLNPYGLWSPRHSQSDMSSSEMEFGTARQYDTTDLFFQEDWLYDDHLFPSKLDDEDDERKEDKFVLDAHGGASAQTEIGKLGAGHNHRHEHISGDRCEGCAEVYTCSSPLCGCCGEGLKNDGLDVARSSSSTVYGRYQIMDDRTEIMDDCAQDGFQLKQSGDIMFECGMQRDPGRGDDDSDLSVVEKELQMLSSFDTDAVTNHGVHDFTDNGELNGICDKNLKSNIDKEYLKGHRIQPFPKIGDPDEAYEF
ncbi:hypothetical protein ZEAMMB73_Zm00001d012540 [Zea mays]|uniref:Uncharacterized protein n=1 Tax=Zea mays TaxID=4577 RepID=A0A1D6G9P0_MAIZE|nr:hypothetical protein ZEAMMB73_Zm00001d012540 [Zea mays]